MQGLAPYNSYFSFARLHPYYEKNALCLCHIRSLATVAHVAGVTTFLCSVSFVALGGAPSVLTDFLLGLHISDIRNLGIWG